MMETNFVWLGVAISRHFHRHSFGMCTVYGKTVYIQRSRTDDPAAGSPGRRPSLASWIQDKAHQPQPDGGTDATLKSHRKSVDHYSHKSCRTQDLEVGRVF